MINFVNKWIKLVFLVILLLFSNFLPNLAFADQIKLNLKELGADKNVDLKTVKTHRDFFFTKPDNWKASAKSNLVIYFQHSPQLLPERSSLNISINDQVIKTIELNKANTTKASSSITIPPNILKDYNKLTFDVDQHYTYKCEDPFDPALWTTVLNNSYVVLDYSVQIPKTDLALFPYPFVDPLAYEIPQLNFVISNPAALSDASLKAMAMINARLSQSIGWKELKVNLYSGNNSNVKGNLIYVGTPQENPEITRISNSLPFKIRNGKINDASGNPVDDDLGVIMFVPDPAQKGRVILVITGNTPEAVLKAASVATQKPTSDILKGSTVVVKQTFPADLSKLRDWPMYITSNNTRLIDIGLQSETVRGVTAVPIDYNLQIMPDIDMPPRNFVKMNLVYSYAANLDPVMSKLEVMMNGVAYHSVKLDDVNGANLKTLQLQIPSEAFNTYNDLYFRFHIFPIKYDICRFTTDEHVWGTIHNTTELSFPSQTRAIIPDMGLINDGGYPFTLYPDMQDDVFILADNPGALDIYGMLTVVARLSKMVNPTDGIHLDVVRNKNLSNNARMTKNLIVIGTSQRNDFINDLKPDMRMIYEKDVAIFKKGKDELAKLKNIPNLGIVEQMINPWKDTRVVMILYGRDDTGLANAISLFSDTRKFKAISRGNIIVTAGNSVKPYNTLGKEQAKFLYGEQAERIASTGEFWFDIIKIFLIVVGILAIIKIIFDAFIRGAKRRY